MFMAVAADVNQTNPSPPQLAFVVLERIILSTMVAPNPDTNLIINMLIGINMFYQVVRVG